MRTANTTDRMDGGITVDDNKFNKLVGILLVVMVVTFVWIVIMMTITTFHEMGVI